MSTTNARPPHRLLLQECLALKHTAWSCFYARFGDLIQRSVRRALGAQAADGNLVDELVADVKAEIFLQRIVLSVYEERADLLQEFLERFARQIVRRYFQRRMRQKKREVPASDAQLAKLTCEFEVLDAVTIKEFRLLLTPAEDRFMDMVLLGNRDKPPGHPPATANERRLARQVDEKWNKFRAEK